MPYFIYRVSGPKALEFLNQFEDYQQARKAARNLRAELARDGLVHIRMMFAKSQAEAEKLLSTPREERYIDEG